MNHLYYIRDKDANLILLKLNNSQQKTLLDYKHNKKIILKSRQQGISTLFLSYYFDDCLFKPGFQAGIQSYGRDESNKLQKRALLMWNELDPIIKRALNISLIASNSNGMEFSNGSILKIGNFRGDTLQGLHVSELAKISKKYPEKARELKTGAFQAVSQNSKITVETTAEGNTGLFPDMWYQAKALEDAGIELTALDFQAIFLSWMGDPDCQLATYVDITEAGEEYLKELGKSFSLSLPSEYIAFNTSNKYPELELTQYQINWLIVKLRELGEDFNREYPATPEMAFAQSIEGTYFKKQYDVIKEENRFKEMTPFTSYKVHTSWDLGVNDEMVILFWQVVDGRVFLIDEYHSTGEAFKHYAEVLHHNRDTLGYDYDWHIFPFDLEVREMSTGRTRRETLNSLGITKIKQLTRVSFIESINIARSMMLSDLIISTKCKNTITAIQNYRKKKDEKLNAYLDTDVHDIHSNYMAAFRYGSQGLSSHLVNNTKNSKQVKSNKKTSNQVAL